MLALSHGKHWTILLLADEHVASVEEDVLLELRVRDVLLQELHLTLPEHSVGVSLSVLAA